MKELRDLLCEVEGIKRDLNKPILWSRITYHRNWRDYTNTFVLKYRNRMQVVKTHWIYQTNLSIYTQKKKNKTYLNYYKNYDRNRQRLP